jgi:hypothetical protein
MQENVWKTEGLPLFFRFLVKMVAGDDCTSARDECKGARRDYTAAGDNYTGAGRDHTGARDDCTTANHNYPVRGPTCTARAVDSHTGRADKTPDSPDWTRITRSKRIPTMPFSLNPFPFAFCAFHTILQIVFDLL